MDKSTHFSDELQMEDLWRCLWSCLPRKNILPSLKHQASTLLWKSVIASDLLKSIRAWIARTLGYIRNLCILLYPFCFSEIEAVIWSSMSSFSNLLFVRPFDWPSPWSNLWVTYRSCKNGNNLCWGFPKSWHKFRLVFHTEVYAYILRSTQPFLQWHDELHQEKLESQILCKRCQVWGCHERIFYLEYSPARHALSNVWFSGPKYMVFASQEMKHSKNRNLQPYLDFPDTWDTEAGLLE